MQHIEANPNFVPEHSMKKNVRIFKLAIIILDYQSVGYPNGNWLKYQARSKYLQFILKQGLDRPGRTRSEAVCFESGRLIHQKAQTKLQGKAIIITTCSGSKCHIPSAHGTKILTCLPLLCKFEAIIPLFVSLPSILIGGQRFNWLQLAFDYSAAFFVGPSEES